MMDRAPGSALPLKGLFGFPLLAGKVIVAYGMSALLYTILTVAVLNWAITALRWGSRKTALAEKLSLTHVND
jgi:hypothetical protein